MKLVVVALLWPLTWAASYDESDETHLLQVKQIVQHSRARVHDELARAAAPPTAQLEEKVVGKVEEAAKADGGKLLKQVDKDVSKLESQATKDGEKEAAGKDETAKKKEQEDKDAKKEDAQGEKDAKKDVKQEKDVKGAEKKIAEEAKKDTGEIAKDVKSKVEKDLKDKGSFERGEAGLELAGADKDTDKKTTEKAIKNKEGEDLKVDGAAGGHGDKAQKDAHKDAKEMEKAATSEAKQMESGGGLDITKGAGGLLDAGMGSASKMPKLGKFANAKPKRLARQIQYLSSPGGAILARATAGATGQGPFKIAAKALADSEKEYMMSMAEAQQAGSLGMASIGQAGAGIGYRAGFGGLMPSFQFPFGGGMALTEVDAKPESAPESEAADSESEAADSDSDLESEAADLESKAADSESAPERASLSLSVDRPL